VLFEMMEDRKEKNVERVFSCGMTSGKRLLRMNFNLSRGIRVNNDSTSTVTKNGAEIGLDRRGLCAILCVIAKEDVDMVVKRFSMVWRNGNSLFESLYVSDGVSQIIGRVFGINEGTFHSC
jgi:hypothetical protein